MGHKGPAFGATRNAASAYSLTGSIARFSQEQLADEVQIREIVEALSYKVNLN